jgi:hypothetical protein
MVLLWRGPRSEVRTDQDGEPGGKSSANWRAGSSR